MSRKGFSPTDLKRLHRTWRRRTQGQLAVLLDGVQNPFNLGSIARSAAAYGVDHGWVAGAQEGMGHAKVQKTAMGTTRFVDWQQTETSLAAADAAVAAGYRIVGVELAESSRPLFELDLSGPICVVVGNEQHGLTAAMSERCDELGYLPLIGRVGSLNVATATALALYEVRRQQWAALPPA